MVLTQSQIHISWALSQECLRGWSILCQMAHLRIGKWVLAVGGGPQLLFIHGCLGLLEYLRDMVAAGLQSEQSKRSKQTGQCRLLEVNTLTSVLFY